MKREKSWGDWSPRQLPRCLGPGSLTLQRRLQLLMPSSLSEGQHGVGVRQRGPCLDTKDKVRRPQPSALCATGCFMDTARHSRVSPQQENVWEFWNCSKSFFFLNGNLRKF